MDFRQRQWVGEAWSFMRILGERLLWVHLRASMCLMSMLQLLEHSLKLFFRRFITIYPFFIGMPELGLLFSVSFGYKF